MKLDHSCMRASQHLEAALQFPQSLERLSYVLNLLLQASTTSERPPDVAQDSNFPLWVQVLSRVNLGDISPSEFSGRLAVLLQDADALEGANGTHSPRPEPLLKALCNAGRVINSADSLVFWEKLVSDHDSQHRANQLESQDTCKHRASIRDVLRAFCSPNLEVKDNIRTDQQSRAALCALADLLAEVSNLPGAELLSTAGAMEFARHHDADSLQALRSVTVALRALSEEKVREVSESLLSFCLIRSMDAQKARGWIEHIIPEIVRGSSLALSRYGLYENRMGFARYPNEVHSADFIIDCLTKQVAPRHVHELMLRGRTLPTLSTGVYLQNRDDGISISAVDNVLRSYIHRESPASHTALTYCLEYFDGVMDAVVFEAKLVALDAEFRGTKLLDKSLYTECPPSANPPEPLIDLLRRLHKNTAQTTSPRPQPAQAELYEAVLNLEQSPLTDQTLTTFLRAVNSVLVHQQGTLGISPDLVHTCSWGGSKITGYLLSLSFEKAMGLSKTPFFRELLLFQELTAQAGAFDMTFAKETIDRICSYWGDDALRAAGRRVLERNKELVEVYRDYPQSFLIPGMLSGTIDDFILGLSVRAKPSSAIGLKYSQEIAVPLWLRVWGD